MKIRFIPLAIIALPFLIAANLCPAQPLDDPYEIMKKYADAIGGLEKLKAEKTSYSEGNITVGTLMGSVKEYYKFPDRKKSELDLKVLKQVTGKNGDIMWSMDANGKVQMIRDELTLKREKVEELKARQEHFDPNSEIFTVTYEGIEAVDDVPCYKLRIANNINDDVTIYYINKSSYMLEKTIEKQPDNEIHLRLSDYRDVNGIKRAYKTEIEIQPVGQKLSITITDYRSNIEIDDRLFDPPGQDIKDYQFTEGNCSENIPFKYIGEHIFFPVNINGRERLWVLDSGAGKSVIDSTYASEMGFEPEGKIKGKGAGHAVDISFAVIPPFSIQGITFDSQQVTSLNLEPFFNKFDIDVGGILGYDFLSRFVTKIDYANQLISFYQPDEFEYHGSGNSIDAPLRGNLFFAPATVDGRYSGQWAIDLGAGSVSFHYPFATENNLQDCDGIERTGMGAGGTFKEKVCQFSTIEFGGYTIKDPLIGVPTDEVIGAFGSREVSGNLGNTLFRHFIFYLDYLTQRLIVEKGDDFDRTFPRDRSGLQIWLDDNKEYEVIFVAPDTPAEKAGFKEDDIIKSINGIKMKYFDNFYAVRDLLKEPAGTSYEFEIERHGQLKKMKMTLKDLY